jgi:hypothetical protein
VHASIGATMGRGLEAIVDSQMPLRYAEGADAALDRPAVVRSASSLAWVPGGIALVQDDANFIGVFDPDGARTRAIALPAGHEGRRLFDDRRGNKALKLDLEACVAVEHAGDTLLLVLGLGSTPRREQVVLVRGWATGSPTVESVHLPRLYEALRAEQAFSGSELNVEGAIVDGDRLRLFGRGNGAPRDGVLPVNATCELDWTSFLAHVLDPAGQPVPALTGVVRYELGTLEGVPLGFTDAAGWRGGTLYSAAAEESPDAVRDGRVVGSAVGVIDAAAGARWAPLIEPSGRLFDGKVEGMVVARDAFDRLLVVVDADDPAAGSTLCRVQLRGDW